MLKGKITSIAKDKGFGFIGPAAGGPDVFFHITVTEHFAHLKTGDAVLYELQAGSEKPRASKVQPTGRFKDDSNASSGAAKQRRPIEMGFVTKLQKTQRLGFISPDSGGPELLFGAENVSGKKTYTELALGDSVRFCRDDSVGDSDVATASNVHYWKRDRAQAGPELPENPNARRRKPTWRK